MSFMEYMGPLEEMIGIDGVFKVQPAQTDNVVKAKLPNHMTRVKTPESGQPKYLLLCRMCLSSLDWVQIPGASCLTDSNQVTLMMAPLQSRSGQECGPRRLSRRSDC